MRKFYNNFDEGTLTKLVIFEQYIKEWIPVFINPDKKGQEVSIMDFFLRDLVMIKIIIQAHPIHNPRL